MKPLYLLPIILLTACATHSKNAAAPAAPLGEPISSDGLRTDEQLKEYRFGRYVDPHDPLVMHEAHPTYRVETSAKWDNRPQPGATIPPQKTVTANGTSANDAVVAEVNKQRAATRAVTEQTAALNQKLTELSQSISKTEEVAKDNLSLKKDVAEMREHLEALDAQLNRPKPSLSPEPSPEDKW
jgi:hypothetical protein